MSLTMDAVSTSPKNSLDGFVMVPNSPPPSTSVEVLNESTENNDQGSVKQQPSSDLPSSAASEKLKDNEILEKFRGLVKENEELRETLKHNNSTLQKHINEFAEMQEHHKQNNENIKKEHQKAKEVVTKLRNENKSLKEQLKALHHENGEISRKEQELGIQRENTFLKQQISTLQEQIAQIDQEIKDNQFTETAVENWQHLLGSIASYEYQTGTLSTGLEKRYSSSTEVRSDDSSLEDRYAKLETEKEILNVDLDKLKVENSYKEEQLLEMLEEIKKLQTKLEHVKDEKEELRRMLNERMEKDVEKENEQQKLMEDQLNSLNAEVESLSEELQKKYQEISKAEEEHNRTVAEYQTQLKSMEEEVKQLKQLQLEYVKKASASEDDSVCKEKFEMIKSQYIKYQGQVGKLEDEKKELQDKLKTYEEQGNRGQGQVDQMKHEKKELQGNLKALDEQRKKLQEELENAKKDKEIADEKLLESRQQMEAELESRSKTYSEKLIQLHLELEEGRNREEHNLKQLEDFRSEVEERKRRELILQEQLASMQEKGSVEGSLRDQVCHLIEENDSFKVKIDKLTEINARRDKLYEERLKGVEKEHYSKEEDMRSIIDMLKSQLGSSKEENKRYLEQFQVSSMENERLNTQYESLLKEYDELLNSYNGTVEENRSKRNDASAEIDNYKRQLDYLAAEQSCFEEALHKKEHQINKMLDELQELRGLKESVPLLKQQLEVYRNDFQAERESRERHHGELLRVEEECERLRMENEDLQRELDNYANSQMAEMQRRHSSHVPHPSVIGMVNPPGFRSGFYRRGGEPDPREGGGVEAGGDRNRPGRGNLDEQPEDPYQCHGCRQNFVRFADLQAHVTTCPAALHDNGPPQPGVGSSQPCCPKCGNEFPDFDTLQIHVLECLDND